MTFEVKQAYFPACSNAISRGDALDATGGYRPSPAECAVLAEPIAYFLSQCSCYDMLGMSTQVIVLDVEAPLAVAFIAAQETRVQSCVLWDPVKRIFAGVLSSTDYIKILLYCQLHPKQAEEVASWTVRHWCTIRDKLENILPSSSSSPPAESLGGKKKRPAGIVTCKAETPLKDCLEKMKENHVRRIVALAEKEGEARSLVAMMDVEHIVEYLGLMFFHIEKSGGSLWRQPGSPSPTMASSLEGLQLNSNERGDDPRNVNIGRSSSGPVGRTTPLNEDDDDDDPHGVFSIGEGMLPPHVTSILAQAESAEARASEPCVGPYRSMFDVPFMCIPSGVGAHRNRPIYVTMEHKLNDALGLMLKHDTESIAVCTPDTNIVMEVISRSDLLRMEDQGVYDTTLTVREALGSKISERVFVFYERDTVRDIFAHFVRRRVKELFLVDPDTGRLLGQLNVAEFVMFLVFAHIGTSH